MPLTTTHSALKILNREVDLFGYIYVHIYIVPPFLPKMFFTPSEYFLRPKDKKAFRYIGIGSWEKKCMPTHVFNCNFLFLSFTFRDIFYFFLTTYYRFVIC